MFILLDHIGGQTSKDPARHPKSFCGGCVAMAFLVACIAIICQTSYQFFLNERRPQRVEDRLCSEQHGRGCLNFNGAHWVESVDGGHRVITEHFSRPYHVPSLQIRISARLHSLPDEPLTPLGRVTLRDRAGWNPTWSSSNASTYTRAAHGRISVPRADATAEADLLDRLTAASLSVRRMLGLKYLRQMHASGQMVVPTSPDKLHDSEATAFIRFDRSQLHVLRPCQLQVVLVNTAELQRWHSAGMPGRSITALGTTDATWHPDSFDARGRGLRDRRASVLQLRAAVAPGAATGHN